MACSPRRTSRIAARGLCGEARCAVDRRLQPTCFNDRFGTALPPRAGSWTDPNAEQAKANASTVQLAVFARDVPVRHTQPRSTVPLHVPNPLITKAPRPFGWLAPLLNYMMLYGCL